ncbi:MAG: hypothetical protein HQL32_04095 [Planctomycetes bacterium]|nr:hypothetical protein [Planctomycetota bacterium]
MSSISDIKEKYGHEPLITLIRKLIITLDQTEDGSDEQKQTVSILRRLSGEINIAPQTCHWLDWLESQNDEELTWEKIEPEQTRKRKVVEIEEDETPRPANHKRMALTKEQALWDQALERHENRGKIPLKKILIGAFILVFLGSGAFLLPKFEWGTWTMPGNSTQSPQQNFSEEALFWADYHPKFHKKPQESWLHLTFNKANTLLPERLNWLENALGKDISPASPQYGKPYLWFSLWAQEKKLTEKSQKFYPLNLNDLQTGTRSWVWRRLEDGLVTQEGTFKESLIKKGQLWDMSIIRKTAKNSSAHRFTLKTNGELAWSWRLTLGEKVLSGSLIHLPTKELVRITHQGFGWKKEVQDLKAQIPALLPGIFSPTLMSRQRGCYIMALSGELCSRKSYLQNITVEGQWLGDFLIFAKDSSWTESWSYIQPK